MGPQFDVVIVGGGPIGLTTACLIKISNEKLKVCVLDKISSDTSGSYSVQICEEVAFKIKNFLEVKINGNSCSIYKKTLLDFCQIFQKHSSPLLSIHQLQSDLEKTAEKLNILLFRPLCFESKETDWKELLDSTISATNSPDQIIIKNILRAQIIIGADGKDSVIRKIMKNEIISTGVEEYFAKLTYQIPYSSTSASFTENICPRKNFTVCSPIDRQTYQKLCKTVEKENNIPAWTFKQLKNKIQKDQDVAIADIYHIFTSYLEKKFPQVVNFEEEICVLKNEISQSKYSVQKYKDKFILLVGDANSSISIKKGLNKGIQEAIFCANTIHYFFTHVFLGNSSLPAEFLFYEKKVQDLFLQEKKSQENEKKFLQIKQSILNFDLVHLFQSLFSIEEPNGCPSKQRISKPCAVAANKSLAN